MLPQVREFIESKNVDGETKTEVAVANAEGFVKELLLRAFDSADLGLLQAAVIFAYGRTPDTGNPVVRTFCCCFRADIMLCVG